MSWKGARRTLSFFLSIIFGIILFCAAIPRPGKFTVSRSHIVASKLSRGGGMGVLVLRSRVTSWRQDEMLSPGF